MTYSKAEWIFAGVFCAVYAGILGWYILAESERTKRICASHEKCEALRLEAAKALAGMAPNLKAVAE